MNETTRREFLQLAAGAAIAELGASTIGKRLGAAPRIKKASTVVAADLFCGAGGTSTGLVEACKSVGRTVDLLAVNHWPMAVRSHQANHPDSRHICQRIDSIKPSQVVPGGRLDLLVASPECIHYSIARGGRPTSDQLRTSPWHILPWLEELEVDRVLIENVPEFRSWGPVNPVTGRPRKDGRGKTFDAFIQSIRALGYTVDWRILNAADYGDATTRKRLFIMARRGAGKISWPKPSHTAETWRPARDVIDWSIQSQSIFNRKRPLSKNTVARIEAGIRKFWKGQVAPFILPHRMFDGMQVDSIDSPLRTFTAQNGDDVALVEPFIVQVNHGGSSSGRIQSTGEPLRTIATKNGFGLVEPFMIKIDHASGNGGPRSVAQPVPAIVTKSNVALVEPFLIKYYGTGVAKPVDVPLDTVTTKGRFALVEGIPQGCYIDIRLRMLQPSELAAAMSFPKGYEFQGVKSDQIRQIGNAVPVSLAKALCLSLLAG